MAAAREGSSGCGCGDDRDPTDHSVFHAGDVAAGGAGAADGEAYLDSLQSGAADSAFLDAAESYRLELAEGRAGFCFELSAASQLSLWAVLPVAAGADCGGGLGLSARMAWARGGPDCGCGGVQKARQARRGIGRVMPGRRRWRLLWC